MSSDDYKPPPSGQFTRLPSIDPTKHVTYAPPPTAPSYPNLGTTTSQPQLTEQSQRSVQHQPVDISPVRSDIRPVLNSTKEITGGFSARGRSSGQAPGFTGIGPNYVSANDVVGSGTKAPTITGLAERDRSDKAVVSVSSSEGETEKINPQDYVGISLVGKKFKQVNPEAYYVEKDDPYY